MHAQTNDSNTCANTARLTCRALKAQHYKNVREEEVKGYELLVKWKYSYQNPKELAGVLHANKPEIQTLINQVNTHADTPLKAKTLLKDQFPKAFFFRKPDKVNLPYPVWEKEYSRSGGIFVKAMAEELAGREQEKILDYINRFAIEHPEQLTMLHFNGRSRDPRWQDISKYSAGHWIYNPGTYLEKDISISDSILHVADNKVFKTGFGIRGGKKNDDIVIVPIGDDGEKLWEQAEQVTLLLKENGAIKVLRGQYNTRARAFKKGKTYIAPHAVEGPWGDIEKNNLMWYYNLSSSCPIDTNGRQCADILSKEIGSWFAKDGIAFALDGIQFDIASWKVNKKTGGNRYLDIDADGVFDKGFIDGDNVFGMGAYHFYTLLRKALGTDKLIIGDGGLDYGMRAVGVANGMEAEGFCDWGDAYKEFAKPLSLFNYWNHYAMANSFSYVTNKIKNGTPGQKKEIERMVLATAQCLGIAFNTFIKTNPEKGFRNGILDELVKGVENRPYWLGKPVGEIIDVSDASEIPLDINGMAIQAEGCTYRIEKNGLIISSQVHKAENKMRLTLKDVPLGEGDFQLKFVARSASPITGFEPLVPRQIYVSTNVVDEKVTAPSVMNYINSMDNLPCRFYFRNAIKEKGDLTIEIEGGGEVNLREISLVNEPLIIAREFENGVVLVNPSLNPFTFDLEKLFKGMRFKRLEASPNQDATVNNGKLVKEKVKVPGLNGLFLEKL